MTHFLHTSTNSCFGLAVPREPEDILAKKHCMAEVRGPNSLVRSTLSNGYSNNFLSFVTTQHYHSRQTKSGVLNTQGVCSESVDRHIERRGV
jgi:hypothetical protein